MKLNMKKKNGTESSISCGDCAVTDVEASELAEQLSFIHN